MWAKTGAPSSQPGCLPRAPRRQVVSQDRRAQNSAASRSNGTTKNRLAATSRPSGVSKAICESGPSSTDRDKSCQGPNFCQSSDCSCQGRWLDSHKMKGPSEARQIVDVDIRRICGGRITGTRAFNKLDPPLGKPSKICNQEASLCIIAYEKSNASSAITTFNHWALFLTDPEDPSEGILFDSSPAKRLWIQHPLTAAMPCCGCEYQSAYRRIMRYRPADHDKVLWQRDPIAGRVPPFEIERAGTEIDVKDPYCLTSNNCQNWVIKVLEKLVERRYISPEAYNSTAKSIQKETPAQCARWKNYPNVLT